MAELTSDRFLELDALADRYTRMMGTYTREDLLAAGFNDAEVDAYEANREAASVPRSSDSIGFYGESVAPYDPTLREDLIYGLAEQLGGDDYSREDARLAERLVTLGESVTPLGAFTGVEQGVRTAQAGYRSGDPVLMGLGALEAGVSGLPGIATSGAAVGRAGREVSEELRRQADEFLDNFPTSSGVPQRLADMDARAYVPSPDELNALTSSPGPVPDAYFHNLAEAETLEYTGADPLTTLNRTGVVRIPIRDDLGQVVGTREVTAVPDRDLSVFRDPYRPPHQFVPRAELGGAEAKYNPQTQGIRIADDYQTDPELGQVLSHETTHYDLGQSDVRPAEVGSNTAVEAAALRERVQQLQLASIDPKVPENVRALARDELRRIRREDTSFINYTNNPGEILARAFSGDDLSYRLPSISEVLNPRLEFFPGDSSLEQAARLAVRPDLYVSPPPALRPGETPNRIRTLLRGMRKYLAEPPMAYGTPLDLSAGRVSSDPGYAFDPR